MTRRLTLLLLITLACVAGLSACGNKGDLVRPDAAKTSSAG